MSNDIRIRVHKATEAADPGSSKFFGDPTVPLAWEDKFEEDLIFFGQIRLSDIAHLDIENRLPHRGYLYFFLDTEMYPYYPMIEYYDGEPELIIDEFNAAVPEFAHLTDSWEMEFLPGDSKADGIRLLGESASECGCDGKILLQFDPLEADMGFLDHIDGYAYFLFGKDETNFDEIEFVIDWM